MRFDRLRRDRTGVHESQRGPFGRTPHPVASGQDVVLQGGVDLADRLFHLVGAEPEVDRAAGTVGEQVACTRRNPTSATAASVACASLPALAMQLHVPERPSEDRRV